MDSTKFVRADTSDTLSGSYTITSNLTVHGNLYSGKDGGGESWHYFYDDNSNQWRSFGWDDSSNCFVAEENDGGHHRVALVSTDSSTGTTNFPIGHMLPAAFGSRPDRRANRTLYLYGGDNDQYVANTHSGPKGAALTGTYRSNGLLSSSYAIYTRVA
ncbi:hypothetical protein [Roseibium sediminicola]|uniref:Uncharacterized protein n=1 Tax=Roseibium sediminicola TaxID=2933272 RepID=A0ABT0GVY1_9HYPH|nr:hypothetical protein [Roseibium sp. CAU 1639]MCK7613593.1 hypothetical protein [Roseibium sp. CAU 1639]